VNYLHSIMSQLMKEVKQLQPTQEDENSQLNCCKERSSQASKLPKQQGQGNQPKCFPEKAKVGCAATVCCQEVIHARELFR
jgi:hypothetical protein